jgi:hypothetical protein
MRTLTQDRGEEFRPRVYLRSVELPTHPMPTSLVYNQGVRTPMIAGSLTL